MLLKKAQNLNFSFNMHQRRKDLCQEDEFETKKWDATCIKHFFSQ